MLKRTISTAAALAALSFLFSSCVDFVSSGDPLRHRLVDVVRVDGGSYGDSYAAMTVSSFHIGKYEVTQSQYAEVMGRLPADSSSARGLGDQYPAYSMSWYEAIVFCNRLSIMEGFAPAYSMGGSVDPADWGAVPTIADDAWDAVALDLDAGGYRLPTLAEWQFAALGGNASAGHPFAGGDTMDALGWYSGNSDGTAHPVGGKAPNELGLYDMCGNVKEWCWDWYPEDGFAQGSLSDDTGPASGSYRDQPGGGYSDPANMCSILSALSTRRPYSWATYTGLRVVRSIR